ncbi:MAG: hypothetical protein PHR60_06810 [Eubacteriales bacterium]|nr:hypothetical protein [Eubacteriales bacterium]MDD4583885.1 hypothetical protein [Eubacteriales bacterium]
MKVLIVFIGLLIVNVTFVIYQGDLGRYIHLQTFLKAAAEECAAGAALYYDEEAYGHGTMIINRGEAIRYTDYIVEKATRILDLEEGENLSYEMEIDNLEKSPTVAVTLQLTTRDLFRLPFLKVEQVARSAKYQLADYERQ